MCITPVVARQRPGKNDPAANNTRNSTKIVGGMCLCIPLALLGNSLVKTFPWQQNVVGGVVFYAVRVASKEIR
jgi:hypothetical protein